MLEHNATKDEEFLERLRVVFERFRQFNITLNPKKCYFGLAEVEFVGHVLKIDRWDLLFYGEEDQGLELRTTCKTEATKIFLRAG